MDQKQLTRLGDKSFWRKPEGTVGKVGLFVLLAGLGFLVFKNMGLIAALLSSTLTAIFFLCAIAAVIYVLLDGRLRTLLSYIYKSIIRFLTSIFITIDPIGILKNYLVDLRKKQEAIHKQISNLKGEMGVMEKLMKENDRVIQQSQRMASAAQKAGENTQVVLNARRAGRKQNFNKSLSDVFERMSKLYNVLKKISENVEFFIQDLDDEVQTREAEYKAIKAGHSAIRGALSVFKGLPNKVDIFNEAMDYVIEDTGRKIGEIEYFLEASETFISGIDVENHMFEMEGLEMLEKWEQSGSSLILDDSSKAKLLSGAQSESVTSSLKKIPKGSYADIISEWKQSK